MACSALPEQLFISETDILAFSACDNNNDFDAYGQESCLLFMSTSDDLKLSFCHVHV